MQKWLWCFFLAAATVATGACNKEEEPGNEVEIYKAAGDINVKLAAFRTALGNLNTAPGAASGRREVNWDGIPDSLLNVALPQDFFNPVGPNAAASRQRGLAYSGGEFQASANGFAHINSGAAKEFRAFSGDKVFANVSGRAWPVGFRVAGETKLASVKAFGAVFSDVDVEGSVMLQFFEGEESLGTYAVPAHDANSPFSFFGIRFLANNITKVMVQHQGILAEGGKDISQGGADDLIVLDDLIYSEPVKLEE